VQGTDTHSADAAAPETGLPMARRVSDPGRRRVCSETLDRLLSRPLGAAGGPLWSGRMGSALMTSVARQAGTRIGNYEIVEEIGRGGTSVVYRARRCDGAFCQEVALKLVHSAPALRGRARIERNILGRLRHPNIAQIIDGSETDAGEIWFAMELISGEHIDACSTNRNLTWRQRIVLVMEVCDAVGHAHAMSIVHGDIKPGNIIVDAFGRAKLVDFGISSSADPDDGANPDEESALTPCFASPEQFSGGTVTPASDIFQIGRVIEDLVSSATDVSDFVALNLAAVVSKATRYSPAQRYENAGALRADLQRVLDMRLSDARPWTACRRLQFLLIRKRETWPAIAAAIFIAAVGVACTCPLIADSAHASTPPTPTDATDANTDSILQTTAMHRVLSNEADLRAGETTR
jgi:eukaryotic-like serine/threonine-protein kinase